MKAEQTNSDTVRDMIQPAGLFRRLFAIAYDSFLLVAILLIVSGLATILNSGTAVESGDALYPVLVFIIFALCYMYFAWFWINGGQTLGMKTWRLKIVSSDNTDIDWHTTSVRFFFAIISWAVCGLGFLWSLFDRQKRCWHDIRSDTVLIDLRKARSK